MFKVVDYIYLWCQVACGSPVSMLTPFPRPGALTHSARCTESLVDTNKAIRSCTVARNLRHQRSTTFTDNRATCKKIFARSQLPNVYCQKFSITKKTQKFLTKMSFALLNLLKILPFPNIAKYRISVKKTLGRIL